MLYSYERKCKMFFNFYWRIISLQNCVGFCQKSTWVSHRYTYAPSLSNLLTTSLPTPPLYFVTEPQFEFWVITANSHWLSSLHMVMWVSMLLSLYISPSPSSPLTHVHKSVLCLVSSLLPCKWFHQPFKCNIFQEHLTGSISSHNQAFLI